MMLGKMFKLTLKELLELKYWLTCDRHNGELALRAKYLEVFGLDKADLTGKEILEVGTGPFWGLLPMLDCAKKVGVDCLYDAYHYLNLLDERDGILMVAEPFEHWETNDQFDVIVTTNALDHGEMGFYLVMKMWRMLRPGGRLYLHVHLRPADMLNLIHDHSLTQAQLDAQLANTDLIEERRELFPNDVDGAFCETLVGVWRKP